MVDAPMRKYLLLVDYEKLTVFCYLIGVSITWLAIDDVTSFWSYSGWVSDSLSISNFFSSATTIVYCSSFTSSCIIGFFYSINSKGVIYFSIFGLSNFSCSIAYSSSSSSSSIISPSSSSSSSVIDFFSSFFLTGIFSSFFSNCFTGYYCIGKLFYGWTIYYYFLGYNSCFGKLF